MFNSLSNNLSNVFNKLKKRGIITESDLNTAMREVRIALLEADVALPVAKEFIKQVKEKALGQEVIKSVSPTDMIIKIVNDHLEELLQHENSELNFSNTPPITYMMVGLQGSGKTTTAGKLALHLKEKHNKKILLVSCDTYRPAAQDQLALLAQQIEVTSLPIIKEETPEQITKRALKVGKTEGYDIIILDTAGRLHIDDPLMEEIKSLNSLSTPSETLLVVDALTGQDAVNVAKHFNEALSITGIILTRIDGDARGGAALSMKNITGSPIKFLGSGEKITELEPFHADRIASRILGMGDVVSLVERAAETVSEEETKSLTQKIKKGQFDFNDLAKQFKTMRKMGGIGNIMSMMPGIGKFKDKIDEAGVNDQFIKRQEAIIHSMTTKERRNPKLINASRKQRIAKGAGQSIQDVNRLIKQHKQMSTVMKKFSKMDKKSLMRSGLGNMLGGKLPPT